MVGTKIRAVAFDLGGVLIDWDPRHLYRKLFAAPAEILPDMEPEPFTIRLARFPFMSWFDGHVISGVEGVAKPDPQIFTILLDRFSLAPDETAFTDDSPANVEAARELGIRAVHFTGAQQVRQELRALGIPGIAPA
jgi:FMN phosphatase YigB (HAD superfamily)